MKSLDEHNKDMWWRMTTKEILNSMAHVGCPKCGEMMYYSSDEVLTSNPPKRHVHCRSCGHKDYKVVEK